VKRRIRFTDGEVVAAALGRVRRRPSIGFSDCLLLEVARKAGHLPLGTFDRDLGKLDGAQSL
jgi:predicted nucleic acid-binding protein